MKLKTWREVKGLSQAAAAGLVSFSQAAWSRYENGRIPRDANLAEIVRATGGQVTLSDWDEHKTAASETSPEPNQAAEAAASPAAAQEEAVA